MDIIFTRFGKIEREGDGLEYIDIQGSGLGLFISKEIVDLHEGTIRAESEGRHKGSEFIVKLPIKE
jgi:signal transduction histidine kinase